MSTNTTTYTALPFNICWEHQIPNNTTVLHKLHNQYDTTFKLPCLLGMGDYENMSQ